LPGIGPPGRAGHQVELAKKPADDLIGVLRGAEMIELFQDFSKCSLDVVHRCLGELLALIFQTLLALDELLPVERGPGRRLRLPDGKRVGEEASDALP
jgi:hypothetical protein